MQNGSNGAKTIETDVAILGGGPTGSTCATFLRKYNPDLRVTIVEKEVFPREHVGESQLPSIGPILDEMGVWDKVEASGQCRTMIGHQDNKAFGPNRDL